MFYHDHAWGITRLNVYAGEAAPYIITDATEQALVDGGIIPGPDATIPLVIQDKTFVPNDAQLALQDETWDTARWGGEGTVDTACVLAGAKPGALQASTSTAAGRTGRGSGRRPKHPYPPVVRTTTRTATRPGWCEPPLMPGALQFHGMEAFHDTIAINGTAYPRSR
jgi:hypothetical protein